MAILTDRLSSFVALRPRLRRRISLRPSRHCVSVRPTTTINTIRKTSASG
ncbi:hypothetical protein EDWATA_01048 [Edwardsiella tarda ATCC 23685]|uniref:Uncharacterized protein n=1 Tax=Edwardsiella tarda ATCC 23685 TaxID=500638 RepID=D4F2U7_EDWTA|nr:hypothetical protein EDWATA_01048 [Edwardsiella tarda ATCC 23685]